MRRLAWVLAAAGCYDPDLSGPEGGWMCSDEQPDCPPGLTCGEPDQKGARWCVGADEEGEAESEGEDGRGVWFVTPEDDDEVAAGQDVPVEFGVENFVIPDEGHLHFYEDDVYTRVYELSFDHVFTGGFHSLRAELVTQTHASFDPPVEDGVDIYAEDDESHIRIASPDDGEIVTGPQVAVEVETRNFAPILVWHLWVNCDHQDTVAVGNRAVAHLDEGGNTILVAIADDALPGGAPECDPDAIDRGECGKGVLDCDWIDVTFEN